MKPEAGERKKWVRQRKFNRVWLIGDCVLQIILSDFQGQQWAMRLIPSITFAHNRRMKWAVGLDWIFGNVNFGLANQDFVSSEKARMDEIKKQAIKTGITIKQQKLRWEGY